MLRGVGWPCLAGRHSAAHRCRRSNERSLARRSRDRGSIRNDRLAERSGKRGRSPVVRSIDRSRRSSGASIGGAGYPIRTCGRGLARESITWRNYMPFSSRPSRYIRRGADRKGSLLVPTALLEIHDLADGPAIADSLGNRSLHNTSSTLNLCHCYLSHLKHVTFDWSAPYPASLNRSTLGSNRDRKAAASIGSAKQ